MKSQNKECEMKRIAWLSLLVAVPLFAFAQQKPTATPPATPPHKSSTSTISTKLAEQPKDSLKVVQKTSHRVEIPGTENYFTYYWEKPPVKGTDNFVITVYNAKRLAVKDYQVSASVVPGSKPAPVKPIKMNERKQFVLPVEITKEGDWQISITILKDGKEMCKKTDVQKI
jgi:hypothetical protein